MWQGNLKADEPYLLISKSANSEKTHLRFLDGRPGWPTSAQAQERIPKGTEDRAVVQAGEYDKAIEVLFWVSSTISSDFSNPLPLIRFCFNVVRKSLSFVYCMCPAWIRNRDIASALAHGFGSMLGTEMGLTRRALGGGFETVVSNVGAIGCLHRSETGCRLFSRRPLCHQARYS